MKKAFAVLLIISTLLLCGCNAPSEETEKPTENEIAVPTEKPTDPREGYKNIKREQYSTYKKTYFGLEGGEIAYLISLPTSMVLQEQEAGFSLFLKGKQVGSIFVGKADDLSRWSEISSANSTANSVKKRMLVEYNESSNEFRHRIEYDFDGTVVTLLCDYAALDDEAVRMVGISASVESVGISHGINTLSELRDKKIIILGNSFIHTSFIGQILDAMISQNNKDLDATAISRGYAEVDTYIGDEDLMAAIRAGEYDGVFICGFYANEEADHLEVLAEACAESDTELVIFPAHNESRSCIELAQERCPDLKTVDWKGEIDMLIENGIDQGAFCIGDIHNHSTPLAGYVGAQMIYRAIYGEIPTLDISNDDFKSEEAKVILGNYMETGKIRANIDINYFG